MRFHRQGAIDPSGAVVQVFLGVPHRLSRHWYNRMRMPRPVSVNLLIDTGCSMTMVKPLFFEALKLQPHADIGVSTASTDSPVMMDEHLANIVLEDRQVIRDLRVISAPMKQLSADGLLGRDVLRFGSFNYEGGWKQWTLNIDPPPYDEAEPASFSS